LAGQDARGRRVVPLALAVVVSMAVAVGSFLPPADKRRLHSEGRFHSWGHLAVFCVVGFVAARTAHSLWARIAVFSAAIAFGFAIEYGEHCVFGSPLEWKDVLVDALGVIGGTLIAMVVAPRRLDSRQG
jgi:uncharacterized membrane protein